jgi:hypothetical protein
MRLVMIAIQESHLRPVLLMGTVICSFFALAQSSHVSARARAVHDSAIVV